MKIKDLLEFNPEAELSLLGPDYVPIELTIYGWSSLDGDSNCSDRESTPEVHLIINEHKNKIKNISEA